MRDHPSTLETKNNLAVLYREQARYEEEKYLLEAIEGHRLRLGGTRPHTSESLSNVIALYEAWNNPEEAEKQRAQLPKTEALKE